MSPLEILRITRPLLLKGLDGIQYGLVVGDEPIHAQGLVRLCRNKTALALDEPVVLRPVALSGTADDNVPVGEFRAQQVRGGLRGRLAVRDEVALAVALVRVFHGPDVHARHVADVNVPCPADLGG